MNRAKGEVPSTPCLASYPPYIYGSYRRGTILIIVAGISALMATLSLTFLVRMRSDAEESRHVIADAQARIMLVAGLNYIQEASRLGWEKSPTEREAFGWVDVRDGLQGPKTQSAAPNAGRSPAVDPETGPASENFPIGTAARFPMWVWKRTRYAISPSQAFNPIERNRAHPDFGIPYLRYPDPQPVARNGWAPGAAASAVNDTYFKSSLSSSSIDYYVNGDPRPRTNSSDLAWFRVYRARSARFIITCGAGATQGFKTWSDIPINEQATFGDEGLWLNLRNQEVIMWYEVEWSPAVSGATFNLINTLNNPGDHYQWYSVNVFSNNSQPHPRNMAGTFRYIQALRHEPDVW